MKRAKVSQYKMAIRKVVQVGHPILRKKVRELSLKEIRSKETSRLIQDLVDTMRDCGARGIAAPQILGTVRVFLIEIKKDSKLYPRPEPQKLTIFINPKITVLDNTEKAYSEGCLSFPDFRGVVSRPQKIKVRYLNERGNPKEIIAQDFFATLIQHEVDHLDGILLVDRLKYSSKLAFSTQAREMC